MTAQELKNSILQLAIQGKLVKQDQNDEPASVLLKKIKEEREKLIKEKKIKKEKYSEIYKDSSDNHYYEKFEDGTINDITDEIPFDIPDSWCWTRLNNILNVNGGKRIPKGEKLVDNITEHIYIRVTDMKDNTISDEKIKYIENHVYEQIKKYIISSKDLYLTIAGTIGKIGIIPEKFNNMNLTENAVKLCNININKYIVLYFLQSAYIQNIFNNKTNKVAQPKLAITRIEKTLFPLPPNNEQVKIINKIEKILSYIKEYDIKNNKLNLLNISYKEELKKSILQYAIQGKLIKQNINDESAEVLINKILDEKRELIKTKQIKKENLSVIYKDDTDNQFYEKFDDGRIVNITDEIPFDIPNNWRWARMKNICLINPKNSLDDNLETSFIPMSLIDAGYSNSHTYEIKKWKEIKSGFTHFKENDIGLAKITPCFQNRKSTIFSNLKNGFGAGTTELYILRPINDLIYTKFIFWLIKSPYFIDNGVKTYSGTAGQQRINKDFIPNFLVPIPNYKTQVCIINKIENIFNLI